MAKDPGIGHKVIATILSVKGECSGARENKRHFEFRIANFELKRKNCRSGPSLPA
jgi:hypothetical protein